MKNNSSPAAAAAAAAARGDSLQFPLDPVKFTASIHWQYDAHSS